MLSKVKAQSDSNERAVDFHPELIHVPQPWLYGQGECLSPALLHLAELPLLLLLLAARILFAWPLFGAELA